jgi:hypothetical protein
MPQRARLPRPPGPDGGESARSIFGGAIFGTFKTGDQGFCVVKVPHGPVFEMDVALSQQRARLPHGSSPARLVSRTARLPHSPVSGSELVSGKDSPPYGALAPHGALAPLRE